MSEEDPRAGWSSELPQMWTWAKFSDVALDNTDSTRKLAKKVYQSQGSFPVIDQGEEFASGFSDDESLVSTVSLPCIVWGDHTRRSKFVEEPFIQGADGVKVLEPSDAVLPKFLYRLISFAELPDKGYSRHYKFLKAKEFPLPPLPEQKRIVRKLDTLSARTTTARAHLTAIAKLVERYREAILSTVFSEFGSIFPKQPLASLCTSITDGDHQAPPKAVEGIPFITISAMNTGWIDLSKATRFVPESYYEELKPERRPRSGDVLFSVTGSIGIPAPVEGNERFVFQRHIAILRPDIEKAIQSYLLYALQSPQVKQQGLDCATGIAQLTIPLKGLRTFIVPAPPVDAQREIVRRIETAFSKIDRLAAEAEKALKCTDRLDQLILAKAFAGELVPQDPNDEPASALLERIREVRANASKKPRQSRTKAKTMKKAPKDLLLADSAKWPANGVTSEELGKRVVLPHDDLRDALFELLGGTEPKLVQVFDKGEERMRLKRATK